MFSLVTDIFRNVHVACHQVTVCIAYIVCQLTACDARKKTIVV